MALSLKLSRTVVLRCGAVVLAAGCVGGLLVWVGATHRAVAASTAVNLGDAAAYAVLASGTVTGSATSTVTGDVGGSTVGGLDGQVTGAVRTGTGTAQALADMNEAADTITANPVPAALPGVSGTLGPGVHEVSGTLDIPGALTLDAGGNADAVFIVRTASTFTTGDGTRITLAGGARACHVFWMADDSATVDGTVVGTVVAGTGLDVHDGASVTGRLLSRTGDVTLDHATVRVPTDCSGAPSPLPAVPTGSTAATGAPSTGTGDADGSPVPGRAATVLSRGGNSGGTGSGGTTPRTAAGSGAHHASSSSVTAAATGGAHGTTGRTSHSTGSGHGAAVTAPALGAAAHSGAAQGDDTPGDDTQGGDDPGNDSGADGRVGGVAAATENVIRGKLAGLDGMADH